MLLTTAGLAIARKVKENNAKKKEARQGVLSVGDASVAQRAFTAQTARMIKDGPITTAQTSEDLRSKDIHSPSDSVADTATPHFYVTNAAPTPQPDTASPVQSMIASPSVASPSNDYEHFTEQSNRTSAPPPYSSNGDKSAQSPSIYSQESSSTLVAPSDARSITSTVPSFMNDPNAVKVRTNGSDLKSGFPYSPALFDLQVHPQRWAEFTEKLVDSCKFDFSDHAAIWASAAATAATGAWVTSVFVGRGMNRHQQEKKVKAGISNTSDGSLGAILEEWNNGYFQERGLYARLELSESAMKRPGQSSRVFRKETHWYKGEEKERKKEERKFVIVVSKLPDEKALSPTADSDTDRPAELSGGTDAAIIPELAAPQDAKYEIAEMPGDEGHAIAELPAMELPACVSLGFGSEKLEPPVGYAELDSDITRLLGETKTEDQDDWKADLKPRPLMVTGSTHEALNKELT